MNLAFYSAYTGAHSQQTRLDAIANNIANVNNDGYRAQDTTFQNLIYQYFRAGQDVRQGSGTTIAATTVDWNTGAFSTTGGQFDFAIDGTGFFAVRGTASGQTYYTRSGSFEPLQMPDGQFYLCTPTGEQVLDANMNPIVVQSESEAATLNVGVFTFAHTEGFTAEGDNLFLPGETNGAPVLDETSRLVYGSVEASNVDLAGQFANIIETQRLYQMTLRMLQTADEIENTINNFR